MHFPSSLVQVVALLSAAGVLSWALLIGLDTVAGLARAAIAGKFAWSYVPHFLTSNLATTEARVMGGLVVSAALNSVLASTLHGASLDQAFGAAAVASAAAFTAGAAAQDAALVRDILSKISSSS